MRPVFQTMWPHVNRQGVESLKRTLAVALFNSKAVKFGQFKLKLHETQPDAPLSPIYIDFRTLRSDPQGFALAVGIMLKELQIAEQESALPDYLADIPTAATLYVGGLGLRTGLPVITPKPDKKTHGIAAAIEGNFEPGKSVWLFDDLVTSAKSKLDCAEILTTAGLNVTNTFVFLDRQQGGMEAVGAAGYPISAFMTISELLDILVRSEKITPTLYAEVMTYLGLN